MHLMIWLALNIWVFSYSPWKIRMSMTYCFEISKQGPIFLTPPCALHLCMYHHQQLQMVTTCK
jgi:hypothetical protein